MLELIQYIGFCKMGKKIDTTTTSEISKPKKADVTKSSLHSDPSLGLNFRLESDEFSCVTFVLLLGEDNG